MLSSTINVKLAHKWVLFLIYLVLSLFAILHHEIWFDELHSWNIARNSMTIGDVIANSRYEGHPPVWYVVLWSISRYTTDIGWIQVAQWLIITSAVFVLIFFSTFPLLTRILIPFGYFFLFEYAILSRNYAIALLPAFCICVVMGSGLRYKRVLYYVLLFFLANTHLLGLILAGSLHLYFLLLNKENAAKPRMLLLHFLLGSVVLLPTTYFIFPPSDSMLTLQEFLARIPFKERSTVMLLAPFKSFIPVPAWWKYNFWNTQFLLEAQQQYRLLKVVTLMLMLAIPLLALYVLRGNKKSLILFVVNLVATSAIAIIFPLTSLRYTGFIFIGFIVAYWLFTSERLPGRMVSYLVNALLVIQLIAGIIALSGDIRYPFSKASHAGEILKEVPAGERLVTDFLGADVLSAYTGKAFYCVDLQRELSFLQWKAEYNAIWSTHEYYYNGMKALFEKENLKEVYFISVRTPEQLDQLDKKLLPSFRLDLVDKRDKAIEKWGNLYLYRVTQLKD